MLSLKKQFAGYYKANIGCDCIGRDAFANIRQHGREWHVEIRLSHCGEIARFAGIWSSLRDAKEELEHIAARDYGYTKGPGGTARGILATEAREV